MSRTRVAVVAAITAAFLVSCVGFRPPVPLPPDRRSLEEVRLGVEYGQLRFWNIARAYYRENPDFDGGKVFLSITIASDGSVTDCSPAPGTDVPDDLVAQVIKQVYKLKFGARDVPSFRYESYPLYFVRRDKRQSSEADLSDRQRTNAADN